MLQTTGGKFITLISFVIETFFELRRGPGRVSFACFLNGICGYDGNSMRYHVNYRFAFQTSIPGYTFKILVAIVVKMISIAFGFK